MTKAELKEELADVNACLGNVVESHKKDGEKLRLAEYRLRCVEALLVAAEDANPAHGGWVNTKALRAAVDGTPE